MPDQSKNEAEEYINFILEIVVSLSYNADSTNKRTITLHQTLSFFR